MQASSAGDALPSVPESAGLYWCAILDRPILVQLSKKKSKLTVMQHQVVGGEHHVYAESN